MYHVLTFHRSTRALTIDQFTDSDAALARRFQLERERGGESDLEIVLLGGSLDELRRTHGRYFRNPAELMSDAAGGLSMRLGQKEPVAS